MRVGSDGQDEMNSEEMTQRRGQTASVMCIAELIGPDEKQVFGMHIDEVSVISPNPHPFGVLRAGSSPLPDLGKGIPLLALHCASIKKAGLGVNPEPTFGLDLLERGPQGPSLLLDLAGYLTDEVGRGADPVVVGLLEHPAGILRVGGDVLLDLLYGDVVLLEDLRHLLS